MKSFNVNIYSVRACILIQWSVLLDQIPLQLQREEIKEREDGERAIIREKGY